jgi:halogenation protein CepH
VLVGDAACFIDPVFSSGVHLSTYSAMLAARSTNTCLKGTIDEQRSFDEFEARYRREFRVFYEFLLRFYDMHQDENSYFWSARKILETSEASNAAFIRLVAGAGTTSEEFFREKAGWMSKEFRERRASPINEKDPALVALRASGKAVVEEAFKGSSAEDRVVTSGLTTSADGQTWEIPKMPWKLSHMSAYGT